MAWIGGNASVTISSLALRTTANGTNIQLALYNNTMAGTSPRPGTLLAATGSIVASTFGNLSGALTSPQSVSPGWYWLCLQTDNIAVRYFYTANSTSVVTQAAFLGSTTLNNIIGTSGGIVGVSTPTGIGAFGTWPSFVGATFTEVVNTAPVTVFQIQ